MSERPIARNGQGERWIDGGELCVAARDGSLGCCVALADMFDDETSTKLRLEQPRWHERTSGLREVQPVGARTAVSFESRRPPYGAVLGERETGFEPATSSLGS